MNDVIFLLEEPNEDTELNAAYANEQMMKNMCPDEETLSIVFPR
jgi:hypothetical protein